MTLPFSMKLNNLFVILLFVNWAFQRKHTFRINLILLPAIFYTLHIGGLFYSSNIHQGLFELEKKVGLFVFSLVLSNSSDLNRKEFNQILLSFVLACTLASLICLTHASYQYAINGSVEYFFYHSLTEIISMHAIYMAMYISFSILILVKFYLAKESATTKLKSIVYFITLLYLLIFLFLLSARLVIVAFILISFCGFIFYGYKRSALLKMSAISALLGFIFISLILFIPGNLERFKEAINYKSQYTIDKQYGGRSTRELIWSCSIQVIEKNILFGVGPGDTQDELQKCYKLDEDKNWALLYRPDFQYNAHSQYLQTFIDLGLLGFIGFLLCLSVPTYIAIKNKNYLMLSFIALFSIACMTESMLELNKGIVFFSFFSSFFIAQNFSNKENTTI